MMNRELNPVQSLILDYFSPTKTDQVLILEGADGCLAAGVAQLIPDGHTQSFDRDLRNVLTSEKLLGDCPNATGSKDVFPTTENFDFVLIPIPKERRFARTLLLAAWQALKPNGQLVLAGPTREGAKAVIKDAERLFGNAVILGYRDHQRVAACTRGNDLPNPLPKEFQQIGIAPGTAQIIEVHRPEGTLKLESHPGIFSWGELDEGTKILLEKMNIESDQYVWDVGCGYGVIGLAAALTRAAHVTMSDVNLLAVKYAQLNAERNQLTEKVSIFAADGLNAPENELVYDLIISNPAFHQGRVINKSMADQLISQASNRLTPHGRLLIVANRFLNYDKFMKDHFKFVKRIVETNKFHIFEARN